MLQLQPFSQILKFGTSFFYFILPEIVWFPEIWHSSAINSDFLKTVEFVYFQRLMFFEDFVYHYRKSDDSLTIFFPLFRSLNKLVSPSPSRMSLVLFEHLTFFIFFDGLVLSLSEVNR